MTNTETMTKEIETETIDNINVRQTPFRDKLATVALRTGGGGAKPENLEQQVTFAQLMSKDELFLPPHLVHNPATCLAMTDMAQRWGFSPFMVGKNTYMVPADTSKNRPAQLGFMNQLIHAVIERWAPIEHRIKAEYGRLEGNTFVKNLSEPSETRRVRVWTRVRGEVEDVWYISPPLADIKPKNSPLWHSDPDQQLFYLGTTRLCRRYFPDILLGIYSVEELMDAESHVGFDNAKLVPKLQQRLEAGVKHEKAEGFSDGIVERTLEGTTVGGTILDDEPKTAEPKVKSPPKRTQKAKAPATVPPHTPANAEEYESHLKAWLAGQNDPDVIEQLWSSEFKLRKACGCSGGESVAKMMRLRDARLKELRG